MATTRCVGAQGEVSGRSPRLFLLAGVPVGPAGARVCACRAPPGRAAVDEPFSLAWISTPGSRLAHPHMPDMALPSA